MNIYMEFILYLNNCLSGINRMRKMPKLVAKKKESRSDLLLALTIFSFLIRVIHLDFPNHFAFDEVFSITRSQKFLNSEVFITDQPHFGRYLTILGMLAFGDNPIGWRIIQAILGTLLIPLSYLIGKKIFCNKYSGLLTAFFVAFDLEYLAYSRIGMVIIFQVFFVSLSLLLFILSTKNNKYSLFFILISAITTGLAIAIKWTSLCLIPVFWLWAKTKVNFEKTLFDKLLFKIIFLVIVVSIYLMTFVGEGRNYAFYNQVYNMPNKNFIQGVISWHKLAFKSHTRSGMYHPYSSKFYTWPFIYKPVLIYRNFDKMKRQVTTIIGFGNPVIRWGGTLAILFQLCLLFFKRNKIMIFLLGSYFISLLAFALIPRPMFLYHHLSLFLYQILILEYTITSFYKDKNYLRSAIISMLILVIIMFYYFYPFANGYPISISEYNHRLWFKSWREYSSGVSKYLEDSGQMNKKVIIGKTITRKK